MGGGMPGAGCRVAWALCTAPGKVAFSRRPPGWAAQVLLVWDGEPPGLDTLRWPPHLRHG
jgi:hypothetical protein